MHSCSLHKNRKHDSSVRLLRNSTTQQTPGTHWPILVLTQSLVWGRRAVRNLSRLSLVALLQLVQPRSFFACSDIWVPALPDLVLRGCQTQAQSQSLQQTATSHTCPGLVVCLPGETCPSVLNAYSFVLASGLLSAPPLAFVYPQMPFWHLMGIISTCGTLRCAGQAPTEHLIGIISTRPHNKAVSCMISPIL